MRRNGITTLFKILGTMILLQLFLPGLVFPIMAIAPLIMGVGLFLIVVKSVLKSKEESDTAKAKTINEQTHVNRNPYSAKYANPSNKTKTFVSNSDRKLIDERLMAYFDKNYSLPVFEDIHLVTKNGKYGAFEELYISKGGEVIISLEEFGNTFPGTYGEILSLLKEFAKQKEEVLQAEVKVPETKIEASDKLSDAEKYIEKINDLNDVVDQEEITNGLYQTCSLLKQIDTASKTYDNIPKLDKLYDYYLPILVKILENYKKLSDTGIKNKDFKDSESQLIKTIILINEALKNINETIHEDEYMNLSADITTLQSLLKKDGLVKEGTLHEGEDYD